MFTGLIEAVEPMVSNVPIPAGRRLCIELGDLAQGAGHGDSICVNGACLTISQMNGRQVYFDVMAETLGITTLNDIKPGSLVNVERAMPADGRFGGHIVQGHVDGVGRIVEREGTTPLGQILAIRESSDQYTEACPAWMGAWCRPR